MPRREHDFYETPPHYMEALLEAFPQLPEHRIVEPCNGEGAISGYFDHVTTNDIDPKRKANTHLDATTYNYWRAVQGIRYVNPALWVVSNPPFNCAIEILEQALSALWPVPVTFLLRLSFLEPTQKRVGLLSSKPPDSLIVLPRYSFRPNDEGKKATDSVTCAWMTWNACPDARPIIIAGTTSA
jgi:hypothetical protein